METRSASKKIRDEINYKKLAEEARAVEKNTPSSPKGLKRRQKKGSPSKSENHEEIPQEEGVMKYEEVSESEADPSSEETDTRHVEFDSKHSTSIKCPNLFTIFTLIVVAICVVGYARPPILFNLMNFSVTFPQKRPEVWLVAEKRIRNDIRPKYNDVLPSRGFRVMEIALKEVLNRNESINDQFRVPSVLLLVGSKSNENIVRCFAKDLMAIIGDAYQKHNGDIIDASTVTKNDIIKRFDSNFNKDASRSIFLDGIDKLKGYDPRVLHPYTDHENAKFKDVVILLSAYSDNEIKIEKNAAARDMDAIANNLLERSWINSMDEDNIAAMLSRLTPSVVVLMNDSENKFRC